VIFHISGQEMKKNQIVWHKKAENSDFFIIFP